MPTSKSPYRSIDGVIRRPIANQLYLAKRRLDEGRSRLLSIQPKAPLDGIKPVVEHNQRKQPPLIGADLPDLSLREQEVVLQLPFRWTVRAGVTLVIQYLLIAGIAVAAGYSTTIGQWFVLAFGLYVLIRRQQSQLTFGIALFILVSVPFFQLINQPGVANNMAVYVFELLLLGTLQALIELKWPKKVDPSA